MKCIAIGILMVLPVLVYSQSQFSSQEFMNFRESNQTLTADELYELYPLQNEYYSSRVAVPDLGSIGWFDSIDRVFQLTEDERELLKNNYFMVTERQSFHDWAGALGYIYSEDLPFFLTTDLILYTLHQSYDQILRELEIQVLEPNLIRLLNSMRDTFEEIYEKYSEVPELIPSLEDVDIYLAVANSLMLDKHIVPLYADTSVYNKIIDAISDEKLVFMPLFTRADLLRKLDFSQFKPRGHYTEIIWDINGERTLEHYFRAMMWLGRIDFLMTPPPANPWDPPWLNSDIRRMNISALLLNEVLQSCGDKALLDRHESIIEFLVGPADNLTPDQLQGLVENNIIDIQDLLDDEKLEAFTQVLKASDDYGQKIMSNFFYVDPDSIDPGELPVSFKLSGQKFLIDSYIFNEVVFDRIVFENKKQWRLMPDPLDILAVFGNENAMVELGHELETYKYAYKINELKYLVDAYDDEFWNQSLYNTWLNAVLTLNPPSDNTKMPYFMKTVAWQYEKMNTQLASWAQLRHDNILYGKQSYTGGTGCSYPYTYVEPYPEFYDRLKGFAEGASEFFSEILENENTGLAEKVTVYYDRYAEIMSRLSIIAQKELDTVPLTEDEMVFLKTMINMYMASGPSITGWINDLLYPSMEMWNLDYTVADVHTQPTDSSNAVVGKLLHVGNGKINLAVIIAPCSVDAGSEICYVGPVASFHTKVTGQFNRLTDEEWEAIFLEGDLPARPEWVYTYLADKEGTSLEANSLLKGVEYNGTHVIDHPASAIKYLLAYPNPAGEAVHFRFLLEQSSEVTACIYDISGRKINVLYSGNLPASEQDIMMPVNDMSPGMYIIQLAVNGDLMISRFIIE